MPSRSVWIFTASSRSIESCDAAPAPATAQSLTSLTEGGAFNLVNPSMVADVGADFDNRFLRFRELVSTLAALPLGLLCGTFTNIGGTAFRTTPVDLGVVNLRYSRDFTNAENLVLFAEHDEIAASKVLVIRNKTVVAVGLAGLVLVAVYTLRDPGLVGFL